MCDCLERNNLSPSRGLVWGGEGGRAGEMLRTMSSPAAGLGAGLASLVTRLRFFPASQLRRPW